MLGPPRGSACFESTNERLVPLAHSRAFEADRKTYRWSEMLQEFARRVFETGDSSNSSRVLDLSLDLLSLDSLIERHCCVILSLLLLLLCGSDSQSEVVRSN